MRLTLVIFSLGPGGAERVLCNLANYWCNKGWTITVITLANKEMNSQYFLNPAIRCVSLDLGGNSETLKKAIFQNCKRLYHLRIKIRASNPDSVISFMDSTNVLVRLSTMGLGIPVIVSEHTNPQNNTLKGIWKPLRKFTYFLATHVVVLTQQVKDFFPEKLQKKITVIPNAVLPVDNSGIAIDDKVSLCKPFLVAMGRLCDEKGFDLLIKAFSYFKRKNPQWHLIILGDGLQREKLEALVQELRLSDFIHLIGVVKNPIAVLKNAEFFVSSSRFEGFGNAICEAMACGLPVISFDCDFGPKIIIRHGIDGLLVPPENIDQLAKTMSQLSFDKKLRNEMSVRALEVVSRFSIANITGLWEKLLTECDRKYNS